MILTTPVVLFIFNRPDTTEFVFNKIKEVKPTKFFIVADGPRLSEEKELCDLSRSIAQQINWECDVYTNFSESNLGCKKRISSGLDWVFNQCEKAIILEDDCVPNPSFFSFCQELLNYYQYDERVMMISGNNFQIEQPSTPFSYYFSIIPHIWGWATWARAWSFYDVEMKLWPNMRNTTWLYSLFRDKEVVNYWRTIFDKVYQDQIDTWDYQFVFASWLQHSLALLPRTNLVSNIGFGPKATHTKEINSPQSMTPAFAMEFPIRHPPYVIRDYDADSFTISNFFLRSPNSKLSKIKKFIKRSILQPKRYLHKRNY